MDDRCIKIDGSPNSPFFDFVAKYVSVMLASGVHTSRVTCCASRICEAYDTQLQLMTTTRHFTLSITDADGNCETRVMGIENRPVSFRCNAELSRLSWQAIDQNLSLEELNVGLSVYPGSPTHGAWHVHI